MKLFSYILSSFAFLLVLVTAVMPWCPPEVSGYLSPLGLLVIPLVIFSMLSAIIAIFYREKTISLLFVIASIVSMFLCGKSWNISFEVHKLDSNTLRLVSWNAEGFQLNVDTLHSCSAFIRKLQPDIICLQERPHDNLLHRDSISAVFEYPYRAFNTREDEVLNLAVYSRFPLSDMKEYYFPDTYNKVLQVDLIYYGTTIRLFNMHLQTTGMTSAFQGNNLLHTYQLNAKERNRQAQLLAEAIASSPYPVILCGDLNDTPISYAYRKLADKLDDCFLEAGNGWGGTYQPANNMFRIDYTFCSPELKTSTYRLYSNRWSDHRIQYTIVNLL